jgi:O-antigen biosynthesis protein WbqP
MVKRLCDMFIALIAIAILVVPCVFIWGAVKVTSSGPALYWSRRAGRNGSFFMMPKFRTMRADTPEVATDKLVDPQKYLTPIGSFLRRTSLDELPQLLSVLRGDMSIVGPRPALHNQYELIAKRGALGIDILRPGITGWAQINGRDDIALAEKIQLDHQYLKRQSMLVDFQIMVLTVLAVTRLKNVAH